MHYFTLVTIILSILSTSSSLAFAQDPQSDVGPLISVGTDKTSYSLGDNIVIFGTVKPISIPPTLILIQITDPYNNTVDTSKVPVSADGGYVENVMAEGNLWKTNGTYTVWAHYESPGTLRYGSQGMSAQITFSLRGYSQPPLILNHAQVEGTGLSVSYTFMGDSIERVRANTTSNSVIMSILSPVNSQLIIDLPRTLIDASANGKDSTFYVKIDNNYPIQYLDIQTSSTDRTISIPVLQGEKQIEVIGTHVIPEFGPVSSIILALGVMSIVSLSWISRLNPILPSF